MTYSLCSYGSELGLEYPKKPAESFSQLDVKRTAVATREVIMHAHDLSKILSIRKGILVRENYPCIFIQTDKIPNHICPGNPNVGDFIEKFSVACFMDQPIDSLRVVIVAYAETSCGSLNTKDNSVLRYRIDHAELVDKNTN